MEFIRLENWILGVINEFGSSFIIHISWENSKYVTKWGKFSSFQVISSETGDGETTFFLNSRRLLNF